jgi:hypothetical protein
VFFLVTRIGLRVTRKNTSSAVGEFTYAASIVRRDGSERARVAFRRVFRVRPALAGAIPAWLQCR